MEVLSRLSSAFAISCPPVSHFSKLVTKWQKPGLAAMGNLSVRISSDRSWEKHGGMQGRGGRTKADGQRMEARPGRAPTGVGRGGPETSENESTGDGGLARPRRPRVCAPPTGYTSVLAKSVGPALWSRENQILRET